ncbi:hypothetical protein [Sphingomonas pituitosa]|uniref:hypothetical protein n=1 Tax=Sphingomonas pituitosa TaxID=99597 RepID=UPI000831A3B8|nr:hypothetical protein [Sphingomonas pituitosa]
MGKFEKFAEKWSEGAQCTVAVGFCLVAFGIAVAAPMYLLLGQQGLKWTLYSGVLWVPFAMRHAFRILNGAVE